MLEIELSAKDHLPLFAVGFDCMRIPNHVHDQIGKFYVRPPWLIEGEHQSGGYMCHSQSVLGIFLPIEPNADRLRGDGNAIVRLLRALGEEEPSERNAEREELAREELILTTGNNYTHEQLLFLDRLFGQHIELPPTFHGEEAFVSFGQKDVSKLLEEWSVLTAECERETDYDYVLYIHEDVVDGGYFDADVRLGATFTGAMLAELRETANQLWLSGIPIELFLLWENTD